MVFVWSARAARRSTLVATVDLKKARMLALNQRFDCFLLNLSRVHDVNATIHPFGLVDFFGSIDEPSSALSLRRWTTSQLYTLAVATSMV
jgi:hypothetical protein